MEKRPFKENALFRGLQNHLSRFNACVGNNGGPYDLYDYAEGYFEENKLPGIHVGDPVGLTLMGERRVLDGHVDSFSGGIADRDRSTASNLLPNVNPTFNWVRLAQRIPVRIALDKVPEGVRLVAGQTVTIAVHQQPATVQ